ncbi:MAG TPA: sodium:proton antiporter [Gammaproteobacteria bacterium]|nr:sodium:proton antiporter [Gammaproteobacteria bacterium]
MPSASVALFFMAMLLAALLLEPLARRLHLPMSAALFAGGFAGTQFIVSLGIDTGLRWYHFHDLVFYVFLPVLIFESACGMNARLLFRNLVPILVLALPLLLLSAVLTAALLFFSIGHSSGFPWLTALVCGALLSATDPVAVTELSKRLPVPARLLTLLEGESLLNDATTVVLFTLLISAATGPAGHIELSNAAKEFLWLALGGLGVGLATGWLAFLLIRWLERTTIISLLASYASYLVAETQLGTSGVMATLACGLLLSQMLRRKRPEQLTILQDWWSRLGWLANSSLFLLAGATVTLLMFQERWLAMLLGIAAVLITRVVSVWTTAGVNAVLPGQQPLSRGYRVILSAGGLRGAVTLALAIALPVELEGWWTVQSIAYGVVLFSLFVQAPLVEPLLKWLRV